MTEKEVAARLRVLGWAIDGPTKTVYGYKATITRGSVFILATRETEVEVLTVLLRDALARAIEDDAKKGQP